METIEPVIDYYKKFGKIRTIDANTPNEAAIYTLAKAALLPQIMFMLGPKASGKSRLSKEICDRTNCSHLDFNNFKKTFNEDEDEEDICQALIDCLANEHNPRIILENFPQSEV